MFVGGLKPLVVAGLFVASVSVAGQGNGHPAQQVGTRWTDQQLKDAVAPMRAGRSLLPSTWPNGARVAVCLTWDMDDESLPLLDGRTEPVLLSYGEYGAREGARRIMVLLDHYKIPGTFYIPAAVGVLHPELVNELKRHSQHEVGVHGWIHEKAALLNGPAEEERLLRKAVEFWTQALGTKPVGYRAPYWEFSPFTLGLIRKLGFEYDSSAMSMDEPYEINSYGQPTGLVELPVTWVLDDAPYLMLPGGGAAFGRTNFQGVS